MTQTAEIASESSRNRRGLGAPVGLLANGPSPGQERAVMGLAIVGAAAGQDALDADRSARRIHLDYRPPVTDAEPRAGTTLEFCQPAARSPLASELLQAGDDSPPNLRIESTQILVSAGSVEKTPGGSAHSIPSSRLISSWETVCPAAKSASASATAASSSSVQGSSSSGASRKAATTESPCKSSNRSVSSASASESLVTRSSNCSFAVIDRMVAPVPTANRAQESLA
jgi:hypothetical protein